MDTFDSRMLGYFDLYARRFSSPGSYRYGLGPAPHPFEPGPEFLVVVAGAPDSAPTHHAVDVRREAGGLVADPPELRVALNDTVRWHAADDRTPRYVVRGTGPTGDWSSGRLGPETVYCHLFGLPGEYRWVNPLGGALSGTAVVAYPPSFDDPQTLAAWTAALQTPATVTIRGEVATPETTETLVGQWVTFVIEDAPRPGVAITDRRLIMSLDEAGGASSDTPDAANGDREPTGES